jgi:hypothetical protein
MRLAETVINRIEVTIHESGTVTLEEDAFGQTHGITLSVWEWNKIRAWIEANKRPEDRLDSWCPECGKDR